MKGSRGYSAWGNSCLLHKNTAAFPRPALHMHFQALLLAVTAMSLKTDPHCAGSCYLPNRQAGGSASLATAAPHHGVLAAFLATCSQGAMPTSSLLLRQSTTSRM